MGKIMILTFNENEEQIIKKIIMSLTDNVHLETVQSVPVPVLSFPGIEIRLHQRRVLRDGTDISLTRLEYGTLAYLASNAGMILSQEQIFEAVWHMDSDTCHTSVVNTIYSLRKKIEPDCKNPFYIKTIPSMGYKFDQERTGE